MSNYEYSQGIGHDGAAILKNGKPMTIEEILEDLRTGQSASIRATCEGLIHLTREHWEALSLLEFAVRQGRGHNSITEALARLSNIHNRTDASENVCAWVENGDFGWKSSCGGEFYFEDGTPSDNGLRFCLYCGNPSVEISGQEPPVKDGHDESM